jgi:hypothetical protein
VTKSTAGMTQPVEVFVLVALISYLRSHSPPSNLASSWHFSRKGLQDMSAVPLSSSSAASQLRPRFPPAGPVATVFSRLGDPALFATLR